MADISKKATKTNYKSVYKPTSTQTSTGIIRKQMSQNTCFKVAAAPDNCCKQKKCKLTFHADGFLIH